MKQLTVLDNLQKAADVLLWLDRMLKEDQELSVKIPRREAAIRRLRVKIQRVAAQLEPEHFMDDILLL